MSQLSVEIRNIIKEKGIGLLLDERFIYMLDDTYHFRDDRAKRSVISSLIADGGMSELVKHKNSDLTLLVSKLAKTLVRKHGYQEAIVNEVLEDIADAMDKKISASQTKHKNIPAPKRIHFPPIPKRRVVNPQPNFPQPKPTKGSHKLGIKAFFMLLWAYLGLFGGSAIYLTDWWVFGMMIVIALIHMFTILIVWVSFTDGTLNNNIKAEGAFSAILPFCVLNALVPTIWLILELVFSYSIEVGIVGLFSSWILTLFYFVFTSDIYGRYIGYSDSDKTVFKKSFWISFLIISLVYIMFFALPIITVNCYNARIWLQERNNIELREARTKQVVPLSFMGITVGEDTAYVFSYVRNNLSLPISEEEGMLEDYSPVDTASSEIGNKEIKTRQVVVIERDTTDLRKYVFSVEWYGQNTDVDLFVTRGKVSKLVISHSNVKIDTLLNMFSAKYGIPEIYNCQNKNGQYVSAYASWSQDYRYRLNSFRYGHWLSHDYKPYYVWTYKNGYIAIYNSWTSYFDDDAVIEYCDNSEIQYLKFINEQEAKELEDNRRQEIEAEKAMTNQRRLDSINAIKEQAEQRRKAYKQI